MWINHLLLLLLKWIIPKQIYWITTKQQLLNSVQNIVISCLGRLYIHYTCDTSQSTLFVKIKDLCISTSGAASVIIGGGVNIHIFVFCIINFFWNPLFLWSVNTNIWIFAPPQLSRWRRHWSAQVFILTKVSSAMYKRAEA